MHNIVSCRPYYRVAQIKSHYTSLHIIFHNHVYHDKELHVLPQTTCTFLNSPTVVFLVYVQSGTAQGTKGRIHSQQVCPTWYEFFIMT